MAGLLGIKCLPYARLTSPRRCDFCDAKYRTPKCRWIADLLPRLRRAWTLVPRAGMHGLTYTDVHASHDRSGIPKWSPVDRECWLPAVRAQRERSRWSF